MKKLQPPPDQGYVAAIDGGSSSIRFAWYRPGAAPALARAGKIDRIGTPAMYFGCRQSPRNGQGFHGLSYACLMERLWQIAPRRARGRVMLAHLGNGASMAARRDGASLEAGIGFTPVGGLPMGAWRGRCAGDAC